jgi:hypothetical protein
MAGRFIRYFLPFVENGNRLSSREQARRILASASQMLHPGAIGIAITYSANEVQTRTIRETYRRCEWKTGTTGANQAEVMSEMESLLDSEYPELRFKVRIAPITTLVYTTPRGRAHTELVRHDLDHIEKLIRQGWIVLGWMNQHTVPKFAVGGGIVSLPPDLNDMIQSTLERYASTYP